MKVEKQKSRAWLFDFFTMVAVIIGLIYGGLELRSLRAAQERDSVLELYRTIQILEDRERTGYDGMSEWTQWLAERLMERNEGRDPTPAYEAYRDWEG